MTSHDTDLAYYYRSSREKLLSACPNRPSQVVVNTVTGQTVPARCNKLRCPFCLPHEALGVAAALAMAQPTQLLLLTQLGSTWAGAQRRMNRFREVLRATYTGGWAYHLEPNPDGTGTHAHAWWRGDHLGRRKLSDAARRAQLGEWVSTAEAHLPPAGPSGVPRLTYGLKSVLRQPSNGLHLSGDAEAFLALNGGRLVHATRGYWRDWEGRPLPGLRPAVSHAKAQARGGSSWTLRESRDSTW